MIWCKDWILQTTSCYALWSLGYNSSFHDKAFNIDKSVNTRHTRQEYKSNTKSRTKCPLSEDDLSSIWLIAMMRGDRVILTVTGESGREERHELPHPPPSTQHTLLIPGPGHEQAEDNYLDHQHADSDHLGLRGSRVQRAIMGPNNSDLTNSLVEAFFIPDRLLFLLTDRYENERPNQCPHEEH